MRARSSMRWKWVVGALLVTVVVSTAHAEDKPWSRAYRFEAYPMIQLLGSDEITGFDGALKIETDDSLVYGGGMGVNLGDHLNINTDLLVGQINMMGSLSGVPGSHVDLDLTTLLWDVNLDYNILKGRLTPLITGGIGLAWFHNGDANISETHFSYNLGAGGRWDIDDRLALRVIYRSTWTQIADADDPFQWGGVTASLIFMFK